MKFHGEDEEDNPDRRGDDWQVLGEVPGGWECIGISSTKDHAKDIAEYHHDQTNEKICIVHCNIVNEFLKRGE